MLEKNKIFKFNNFTDARGGTELMVEGLLKHVNNDLLSKFDIVVSYPPQDYKKTDKISLLWLHDMHTDPYLSGYLSDKKNQLNFDYFIFVSHWQKEMFRVYFDIPYEKCVVLQNAIEPVNFGSETDLKKWENTDKIKIIYNSTPQRGLELLFPVFKHLHKDYGNKIELNVFSSFDIYGEKHKHRNKPFEKLYKELNDTVGVNYYGSVKHEVLLEELRRQHIWCLPSIWPETSCIALMEAMSACCLPVHSDLAALPETSGNFTDMYRYTTNLNDHANILYHNLKFVIETKIAYIKANERHLMLQKVFSDSFYNWSIRGKEWEVFLETILNKK